MSTFAHTKTQKDSLQLLILMGPEFQPSCAKPSNLTNLLLGKALVL